MSKGHVSLVGRNGQVPVIVLRDTGAFDTFILSVLPFSEETDKGSVLPVLGMEMSNFFVLGHRLVLHTALFDGEVKMVMVRNRVLRVSHDESGHMGVSKTYNRILRHLFWPVLRGVLLITSKHVILAS